MDPHWILLIDPFKNLLNTYRMILEEENYSVETADNIKRACSLIDKRQYSALVMEYIPPHKGIQQMVQWVRVKYPEIYILMVTNALVDGITYENLLDIGVDDFILKPYSPQKIIAHIKKGLKKRELISKVRDLENLNLLDPVSREMEGLIFNKSFLKSNLRQEIKRSSRHRRSFSILLIRIPGKERGEEPSVHFFRELSKMIRKFIREEDVVAKNNGEMVLLLPETDDKGSKNMGGRLSSLISNHPPFKQDNVFRGMAQGLSFQYFTYPDQFDLPESLRGVVEGMKKESLPH